jgi:cation:H+ antiporter
LIAGGFLYGAAEAAAGGPDVTSGLGATLIWLGLALIVILAGCEGFANAVEHVGERWGLSHAAAGSLLAAVGTALPETMIPVLALVIGSEAHGEQIGIGAILGAPFMLATLAFFLLGLTLVLLRRAGRREHSVFEVSLAAVRHDLLFFLAVMALVTAVSLLRLPLLNYLAGAVLLGAYAVYVKRTLNHAVMDGEEYTEHFYLERLFRVGPRGWAIAFQLLAGFGLIVLGAHLFIERIVDLSLTLGVPVLVLSLIITPIATELPEKYNSITWTIRRKDALAFGNISGAMVFQATIPMTIGLWFTRWDLGATEVLNLLFAFVSVLLVLAAVARKGRLPAAVLLLGGLFYLIYLVRVFLLSNA